MIRSGYIKIKSGRSIISLDHRGICKEGIYIVKYVIQYVKEMIKKKKNIDNPRFSVSEAPALS
jgi:hypothetical protein